MGKEDDWIKGALPERLPGAREQEPKQSEQMKILSVRMPGGDIERLKAWLWREKREKLTSGIRRIIAEYMNDNRI